MFHTTHKDKPMNKNPFELRYDLLALAHDHLEAQYLANVKFAEKLVEESVKQGKAFADAVAQYMPKFPTIEEIMNEAKKFYSFVEQR